MGTNYYWFEKEEKQCKCCGHTPEQKSLHIGKSSAGWCFSLHAIPEEGLNSLEDWIEKFNSSEEGYIENEYGDSWSVADMLNTITNRRSNATLEPCHPNTHWAGKYEVGPNNLMRHPLGMNCIAHGDGTWDMITGEFC